MRFMCLAQIIADLINFAPTEGQSDFALLQHSHCGAVILRTKRCMCLSDPHRIREGIGFAHSERNSWGELSLIT